MEKKNMTKNLNPFYEALIDDLSQDQDTRYLQYLKAKPRTWVHENLVFDLEKLDSYYQCPSCRQRHPKAFCCRGYDVELTAHDLALVAGELPAVLKAYPAIRRSLGDREFWRRGDAFEPLLRRKANEECIFLMPGGKGCYLHAWALAEGLDPIEVKPYICSLYPVVVIVIEKEVVITTFNDESKIILETGDGAAACTLKRGRGDDHAVRRAAPILSRMFGDKVISTLLTKIGAGEKRQKSSAGGMADATLKKTQHKK
jgi:hypothetical protein